MRHRVLSSSLAGAFALGVVLLPSTGVRPLALAQSLGFVEPFDGAPAHPAAVQFADLDVTVHDIDQPLGMSAMQAQHGDDCSAPPTTHPVSSQDAAVFQCNGHVMTALNGPGYGAIYLTPNQMVDFSQGTATIKFDLSTTRTSDRDWIDVWITPFGDQLQMPADDFAPDLQGGPRNGLQIRMDNVSGPGHTGFKGNVITNGSVREMTVGQWYTGYESFLTPSASRRDTFQLDVSSTHVRFGMPAYNFWWIDTDIRALGWNTGIVQFAHYSYNPYKACDSNLAGLQCGANTWHWDNLSISPAQPYTMLHSMQRTSDPSSPTLTFDSPAPANAHLRFTAFATSMQVSFDNGASWQPAPFQASTVNNHQDGQAKSFWTDMPQGASTVTFRGTAAAGKAWFVRDPAVVAPTEMTAAPGPDMPEPALDDQAPEPEPAY
jgi:hypothetical protein